MNKKVDPALHFMILRAVQNNPNITQRELARNIGISLGAINYCLKSLIHIGHIKIKNFNNCPTKSAYLYLLTAEGIHQKTILTASFLKKKMTEYNYLKKEIKFLKSALNK